jgi:hypothetical protein
MRGLKKIFFYPSYVPKRFFEAAPGCPRAIENFVLPVSHFSHQNETTAG